MRERRERGLGPALWGREKLLEGFLGLGTLLLLAAPALAQGTISSVSPSTASQGTSNLTVTFTLTSPPPVPPAGVAPSGVTVGTLSGTSVTHTSQYTVTAVFSFSCSETTGAKDCAVSFSTPNGTVTYTKSGGFTVTSGSSCHTPPSITAQPQSQTVSVGDPASFTVAASGSPTLHYQWQKGTEDISGATGAAYAIGSVAAGDAGSYRCVVTNDYGTAASDAATLTVDTSVQVTKATYPVVDTGQTTCYGASASTACPSQGAAFYGQDSQFTGYAPSFTKSADGLTVHDHVTGLTWQHTTDTDGDGTIDSSDKKTYAQATAWPATLNAASYGGFTDWRLPTIKEIYSLFDCRGTDPNFMSGDTSGLTPFIDRAYFDFGYGDQSAGERVIDAQYASSTLYVSTAYGQDLFGVNFADGRIKGYGLTLNGSDKTFYVQCVRGNPSYGVNSLVGNGDQTVTDRATGLMWAKSDSGSGMNWQDALAWVQTKNAASYLGYGDWRLPNVKELQSILDYTRSPDTSGSAAIDPVFTVTSFAGELCATDYPWYWSSTTHASSDGTGASADYVCFGRGMGYMNSTWTDVHGAGCQRSDPKSGSLSSYSYSACGYYNSGAPQSDSIRLTNYVRLVRGAAGPLRTSFTYTPASPADAAPVAFTGNATGGTSPFAYSWDLDGTPASGPSPSKTFAAGSHAVVMTVTDAAGLVTRSTRTINVTAAYVAPPPVADGKLAGTAAKFSKSSSVPGQIDVTFGTSPCSASKAVILYGTIGSYSGYAGCAQSDAGNAGTATISASGLENVWFNVVWTNGTTAGFPGYAYSGTADVAETWNAAGLCGITADDHSDATCN